MNEKLKEFAKKNVVPPPSRGINRPIDALVTLTKSTEKNSRKILNVSLHARAIAKLGWRDKDYIEFCITEEGDIVLRRGDGPTARTIRGNNSNSSTRWRIRYMVIPELWEAITPCVGEDVEIEGGSIAFCIK